MPPPTAPKHTPARPTPDPPADAAPADRPGPTPEPPPPQPAAAPDLGALAARMVASRSDAKAAESAFSDALAAEGYTARRKRIFPHGGRHYQHSGKGKVAEIGT